MRSHQLVQIAAAAGFSLLLSASAAAAEPPQPSHSIEMHGVRAAVKFEAKVKGFLAPLNDRVKLRATEAEFDPGAVLGDHLHVGPGIRYVLAGQLTFVHSDTGQEFVVAAGEYIYESGAESLRVLNRGGEPARLLIVELLPADLEGSAMASLGQRQELEARGERLRQQLCEH